MSEPNDDIRPGEVAVQLPEGFDAGLYFIGRMRTPFKSRAECPKSAGLARAVGRIELDARYAAGLRDLGLYSHAFVLYWMDKARRDLVVQAPKHYATGRPTFSVRSPVRPNPIALSVVELRKVEGNKIDVVGLDCLDGTPLLDIKPYFATTDSIPEARVGWHAETKR